MLLAYALDATVPQVEERCRQIRNVAPESVHHARRAWESRSLTMWRDEGRGLMRFTVEVPIEEGELIVRALDCAVAGGEVTTDLDPDAVAEVERHRVVRAAGRCARRGREVVSRRRSDREGGATADHYQVVVHADAKSLTGGAGRSDLPIETVKRLLCDCSVVLVAEDETAIRSMSAANSARCRRRSGARSTPAIAAARSPAVIASGISTGTT